MKKHSKPNGYVALMTLVIVSAIVLIAVIALTFMSVSQSNFILSHNKTIKNYYAANACANYAILQLQKNEDYGGNENLNIDNVNCQISAVSSAGEAGKQFVVSSQEGNQLKKIKVELDQVKPVTIIKSWGEIFE